MRVVQAVRPGGPEPRDARVEPLPEAAVELQPLVPVVPVVAEERVALLEVG